MNIFRRRRGKAPPNPRLIQGDVSVKVKTAWRICTFANGYCGCEKDHHYPCESIKAVTLEIVAAAKAELAEKYVLRKRAKPKVAK